MDISKCFHSLYLEEKNAKPLYLQIAEHIMALIREQELPGGTRLLPERELSQLLGVSRTTVINAYRFLEKEGYVLTRVGSGTYVVGKPKEPANSLSWHQVFVPFPQTAQADILQQLVSASYAGDHISLAAGMADPAFYPLARLQQLCERLGGAAARDFGHIPTQGYYPLRKRLAEMAAKKEIKASAEELMVVSGSQQGLYLLSKILIEPGDYVVLESPSYIGAIQAFQTAGARILPLPENGSLDFALLEDSLIRYRPKLIYLQPTFRNPTGRLLTMDERQQLVAIAAKHRIVIIEDDAYGELYFGTEKPPLPLKALDTYGGVIYLNTLSKVLMPGLRIGWLIGAKEVIQRLCLEKQYIDLQSNNLTQWLVTEYLSQYDLEDHLRQVRREYGARKDAMTQALRRYCGEQIRFEEPQGGFYVWATISPGCSPRLLLYEAAKQGVSFVPGEAFYPGLLGSNQLRLCFTTDSPDRLSEGIRRLAQAMKIAAKGERPQPNGQIVNFLT